MPLDEAALDAAVGRFEETLRKDKSLIEIVDRSVRVVYAIAVSHGVEAGLRAAGLSDEEVAAGVKRLAQPSKEPDNAATNGGK